MKKTITPSTVEVANIQALPDLVVGQASSLKQTFDKTGADTNEYINDVLIPELNGNDGANKIGLSNPELASDNVGDGVAEVLQVAKDAQAGTIIDGSIEDVKLSNASGQIKQRVATIETDLSTAKTDITNLETDIDIIRTAVLDTGTVNNIVVDTAGTFDLTRNGNILTVVPLFTNTNATVNISADAQTNKLIKKANDTGVMVALEVGDIKKNVPTQLVWDSVNDFFIFAPKRGSNIKSIQRGSVDSSATTLNVAITSVDLTKAIVKISIRATGPTIGNAILATAELTSSTNIQFKRITASGNFALEWEVIEFNNVKSIQKGNYIGTGGSVTVTSVNTSKSTIFYSFVAVTNATTEGMATSAKIASATSITFTSNVINQNIQWQLIEFN